MAKFYAHSRINTGAEVDEETGVIMKRHFIEPGEEVTAKKLGVSKEKFEKLIKNGVVRSREYPPVKQHESPRDYQVRKAQEAMDAAEEGLDEAMYGVDDDEEEETTSEESSLEDKLGGGDEPATS